MLIFCSGLLNLTTHPPHVPTIIPTRVSHVLTIGFPSSAEYLCEFSTTVKEEYYELERMLEFVMALMELPE